MSYRLLEHASEQMLNRKVSAETVKIIFENPQQVVDGGNGRKIYQSIINLSVNGRPAKPFLVRLVVVPDTNPTLIVTVIATTQIDRYWKQP